MEVAKVFESELFESDFENEPEQILSLESVPNFDFEVEIESLVRKQTASVQQIEIESCVNPKGGSPFVSREGDYNLFTR